MPKKKQQTPDKFNWKVAKEYYLKSPTIGLIDVAKKFGLNYGSLRIRASKENWGDQKVEFLHALNIRLTEIRNTEEVDKKAKEITLKTEERSRSFGFLRQTIIQQVDKKLSQLKVIKDPITGEEFEETLDTKELEQASRAMKIASEGERLEDGQPTTIEKQEVTTRRANPLFHALGQVEGIISQRELEKINEKYDNNTGTTEKGAG